MKRILRFLRTPLAGKILFGEALGLVIVIRLGLWLLPFAMVRRLLLALSRDNAGDTADWEEITVVVRAVRAASRFVPFASCLTQALAAQMLIRSRGQHSELKIGVTRGEREQFAAHAWLETNGRIIIGKLPGHRQYKVLSSFAG
jgi:hypothetical protein